MRDLADEFYDEVHDPTRSEPPDDDGEEPDRAAEYERARRERLADPDEFDEAEEDDSDTVYLPGFGYRVPRGEVTPNEQR